MIRPKLGGKRPEIDLDEKEHTKPCSLFISMVKAQISTDYKQRFCSRDQNLTSMISASVETGLSFCAVTGILSMRAGRMVSYRLKMVLYSTLRCCSSTFVLIVKYPTI